MTDPAIQPPAGNNDAAVQDLLAKIYNSANWRSEIEKVARRNAKLLNRQRELLAENEELKKTKPKDGERVLNKDEATEYAAYLELKLKPVDMKHIVEEHAKLRAKEAEHLEEKNHEKAAEALGYENVPALTRWLNREKLVLEFRDARVTDEETGKKSTKQMPYVRPSDNEKAEFVALEDYIEQEVPEFLEVFQRLPESEEDEEGDGGELDDVSRAASEAEERVRRSGNKTGDGIRMPVAKGARGDGAGSRDRKVLEDMEKKARANPAYAL